MLNEHDLQEFYEWLERKRLEATNNKKQENLIEQQMHHLREFIRIQKRIMGLR